MSPCVQLSCCEVNLKHLKKQMTDSGFDLAGSNCILLTTAILSHPLSFPSPVKERSAALSIIFLQVALRSAEKQFSTAGGAGGGEAGSRRHQQLRKSLSSVCKKLLASPHQLPGSHHVDEVAELKDRVPSTTLLVSPSHTDDATPPAEVRGRSYHWL
jgi:hypothetical protein